MPLIYWEVLGIFIITCYRWFMRNFSNVMVLITKFVKKWLVWGLLAAMEGFKTIKQKMCCIVSLIKYWSNIVWVSSGQLIRRRWHSIQDPNLWLMVWFRKLNFFYMYCQLLQLHASFPCSHGMRRDLIYYRGGVRKIAAYMSCMKAHLTIANSSSFALYSVLLQFDGCIYHHCPCLHYSNRTINDSWQQNPELSMLHGGRLKFNGGHQTWSQPTIG